MGVTDENGLYIFDQCIMDAHWLISEDTGMLHIVSRDDSVTVFDVLGPDDKDSEMLMGLADDTLSDDDIMDDYGFSIVYSPLRRFSPESGYYTA